MFDEDREYSGERLTLNFQDLETRAVLQLIADFSGLNIVVSDTVQGSVTLRLQNVPWDQALDIVMTTKGLDMRRNGNVIIVAPAEEIAAREQAELEALQALQTLEPLRSEFIQVNYAKAAELATLISGRGRQLAAVRARHASRSTSARTRCSSTTRRRAWPTFAASSRRSTSRCGRCSSKPASSSSTTTTAASSACASARRRRTTTPATASSA